MDILNWSTVDDNDISKFEKMDKKAILDVLQKSLDRISILDEIIESSMDGIYITDGDANAIRINEAFERISGLERKNLLGKNNRDLEKKGIIAKSSAVMALEQKKPVTIIHEYLSTNRKALVTSNPIFDSEGEIKMVVSNIRDLTELIELRTLAEEHKKRIKKQNQKLELIQRKLFKNSELIAKDKKMVETGALAYRMAMVETTVHLFGETGVGKEVLAQYIHMHSSRQNGPFIAINCGAIPENLVESELFGYEKGSFTGALKEGKIGLFEAAEGGTLFLDEVGLLPAEVQIKLLRVLQERNFKRVGGIKTRQVDVRIISATNADLLEMSKEGAFREDLYYRLSVVTIEIPPLRERPDDIIPFAKHFLTETNKRYGFNKTFSEMAFRTLYYYKWPGNVRELKNVIERVVVMSDNDLILAEDLPMFQEGVYSIQNSEIHMPIKERLERIEFDLINEAYEKYHSVRKAADYLGMSAATFVRKKKVYSEKFVSNT